MSATLNIGCSLTPEGILADQEVVHMFAVSCVSDFTLMSISNIQR